MMLNSFFQAALLIAIGILRTQATPEFPICVYYSGNNSQEPALKTDDEAYPDLLDYKTEDGKMFSAVRCRKPSNLCFAIWKEDRANNGSNFVLIGQGCWESSGSRDCISDSCVSGKRQSRASNHARFCCCTGMLCNANVSTTNDWEEEMQSEQGEQAAFAPVQGPLHPVSQAILVAAAVLVFVGTAFACFIWKDCCKNGQSKMVSANQDSALSTPLITSSTTDVKLIDIIGQGRYGMVWRGHSGAQEVAVKVFPAHYRSYFCNERDLYSLPHMSHANLVSLLGYGQNLGECNQVEYRLVLSLAPRGCLQEYLKQNVLDWYLFCKMARGLAKGLAHLHLDIQKGEFKPCIAHRDVNSRNVLVTDDLNLMLCDLGLAIQISGAHYVCNGEHMHAESASLTDVGTLRYMAPEVLEGAVNLRECEASLKQVDIYALGLVLWELASRTVDLYANKQPPAYTMPFHAEVGLHPSLEQMQVMVCRHKARPLFPDTSQCQHSFPPAFRLLKETLEDAWDHDAEARLTALCVEERLAELPALWDRHKGLSPNLHVFPNDTHTSKGQDTQTSDNDDKAKGLPSTRTSSFSIPNKYPNPGSSHSSEKIGNLSVPCQPYHALQPHQGRNPCMERNTMVEEPVDELSVSGNALVRKSDKHRPKTVPPLHPASSGTLSSTAVMSHGTLAMPRPVNPIPFVQNAVREAGAIAVPVRPKQPNVGPKTNHNSAWLWLGSVLGKNKPRKDDEWGEQQQLCPPLSSPSDAADLYALQGSGNGWTKSNLEPNRVTVSTTEAAAIVPVSYCQTQVRFSEAGHHRVSVVHREPVDGELPKLSRQDSSPTLSSSAGRETGFILNMGELGIESTETEVGVAKRLPASVAARSPSLVRRGHSTRGESLGKDAVNTRSSSLLVDVPQ